MRYIVVPLRRCVLYTFVALCLLCLTPLPFAQGQIIVKFPMRVVVPDTALNRELEHAVRHQDARRVRLLLRAGADPTTRSWEEGQKDGDALWWLAASRSLNEKRGREIFALLAERITDVNQPTPGGWTLLETAAEKGNLALVQHLVARGANVNQLSRSAALSSPLVAAIIQSTDRTDMTPLIRLLLEAGADPNLPPGEALMSAARMGKTETVRALLARRADPTVRDPKGLTALRWAAIKGSPSVIALLRGISPMDLHEAAQFAVLPRVQACLDAGADPNLPDNHGNTPLMMAIRGGSNDVASLLIERGARIDQRNKAGEMAIHLAARYGLPEMVTLLLRHGADVNAAALPRQENSRLSTPLTIAADRAQADVVALLLKQGADLRRYNQGFVALDIVVWNVGMQARRLHGAPGEHVLSADQTDENRFRIIEMLTRVGRRALVRSEHSYVLYVAAAHSQPDLVRYLLQKGADVNGRDRILPGASEGETALMGAIQSWGMAVHKQQLLKTGQLSGPSRAMLREQERWPEETFHVLLVWGASVRLPDPNGQTPLMAAYEWNLPGLFQELLRRGATLNARDNSGWTLLMQAAKKGDSGWVQRLLQAGASPRQRTPEGRTTLELARSSGSTETFALLRRALADQ